MKDATPLVEEMPSLLPEYPRPATFPPMTPRASPSTAATQPPSHPGNTPKRLWHYHPRRSQEGCPGPVCFSKEAVSRQKNLPRSSGLAGGPTLLLRCCDWDVTPVATASSLGPGLNSLGKLSTTAQSAGPQERGRAVTEQPGGALGLPPAGLPTPGRPKLHAGLVCPGAPDDTFKGHSSSADLRDSCGLQTR